MGQEKYQWGHIMLEWWEKNFATCELGNRRLEEWAMSIGRALCQGFGKALFLSIIASSLSGGFSSSISIRHLSARFSPNSAFICSLTASLPKPTLMRL